MNEVQMRILNLIGNEFGVTNIISDDDGSIKIYISILCIWIDSSNNIFYEIDKMPRCHSLMLVVSEVVQGIENILNESELV